MYETHQSANVLGCCVPGSSFLLAAYQKAGRPWGRGLLSQAFFWLPRTYHFTEQNFESDSDYDDNDITDEGLSFKILCLKNRTRQQSVNYRMKTRRFPYMFIKKLSTVRLKRNIILKWVHISTACFFCCLSKLSAQTVTV